METTAVKPQPAKPWTTLRRYMRFRLRTVLVLLTMSCLGLVIGIKLYEWRLLHDAAVRWTKINLDAPPPQTTPLPLFASYPTSALPCPDKLEAAEQRKVLRYAILRLSKSEQRTAGLKILVELFPDDLRETLLAILPQQRHADTRVMMLRLLALFRNAKDIDVVGTFLTHQDASTRGVAAESLGLIRLPSFRLGEATWPQIRPWTRTTPPIDLKGFDKSLKRSRGIVGKWDAPDRQSLRRKVESIMLKGQTAEEREAASRAIVGWPPAQFRFRYAEWGVWYSRGGNLQLRQLAAELPKFVHQTGNKSASFADRVSPILIIDKPVIHLTTDVPMAVDIEVQLARGRPWFVYPMPDDFTIGVASTTFRRGGMGTVPKSPLTIFDPPQQALAPLNLDPTRLREGYPWLLPAHRMVGNVSGPMGTGPNGLVNIGVRWQNVIVSPTKLAWMSPGAVSSNPQHQWWLALRRVPSSWISSRGESERFLYYDGPSLLRPPIAFQLAGSRLTLSEQSIVPDKARFSIAGEPTGTLAKTPRRRRGLFIRREGKRLWLKPLEAKAGILDVSVASAVSPTAAAREFKALVVDAGLTEGEASGILAAWKTRFFEPQGQRVIWLLTGDDYQTFCPLKVRPPPNEVVRVGVVVSAL